MICPQYFKGPALITHQSWNPVTPVLCASLFFPFKSPHRQEQCNQLVNNRIYMSPLTHLFLEDLGQGDGFQVSLLSYTDVRSDSVVRTSKQQILGIVKKP